MQHTELSWPSHPKFKIIYINHGIACRIGNNIYLNKRLANYPKLQSAIIKHEKSHTDGLSFKDLAIDFKGDYLDEHKKEYYDFIMKNPSSWTEYLPIMKYGNKYTINPFISLLYILTGVIIWVLI